jgi:hypothetical protein
MSFNSLGLNDELCECVEALGYVTPTPIQEKSIPILLSETTDFIGLAATGTGKTAAFSLPLIQVTEKHTTDVTGLIICPTRELCLQIVREIELFKKPFPSIKVTAVYGGSSIVTQISPLAFLKPASKAAVCPLLVRKEMTLRNFLVWASELRIAKLLSLLQSSIAIISRSYLVLLKVSSISEISFGIFSSSL